MVGVILRHDGPAGFRRRFFPQNDMPSLKIYQSWIRHYDTLSPRDRRAIRRRMEAMPRKPLISVVMPVYNPAPAILTAAIASVREQMYPEWELCIADDASPNPRIKAILEEQAAADPRIRICLRSENGHISAASNSALELATGEYIALMDHDDLLPEHALYWVAEEIGAHPEADVIYSDEDKIDDFGRRYEPYFKPDFNPDLFTSHNMISHLGVYRAALIREIGGFRLGCEGSQDYDLALRAIERCGAERVRHIPAILYHWRAVEGSVGRASEAKDYAHVNARKALAEHFERQGRTITVEEAAHCAHHRIVHPLPPDPPEVSIVIPTRDGLEVLRTCVSSLLEKTDYPDFRIVIVDNQSEQPETLAYFEELQATGRVDVLPYPHPFNYSAMNNMAVAATSGQVLAFLNNDLEVISPTWLTEMVSQALRPEIGAVGAKLYYPDDHIQHAGVVLGLGGVAGHVFSRWSRQSPGYFGRAVLLQNYSAVTAACLVMRRRVFEEIGGFEDQFLKVAFNDIDLCLRVRERGYRILFTPYAELYHHESWSRGSDATRAHQKRFRGEIDYMERRWGDLLQNDPCYSPNLALTDMNCNYSHPPRVTPPWRT